MPVPSSLVTMCHPAPLQVDLYDYHIYTDPETFLTTTTTFDTFNRSDPPVIVSEMACQQPQPNNTLPFPFGYLPTLRAAVAEAAWMTGLLRNSDVVVASCCEWTTE